MEYETPYTEILYEILVLHKIELNFLCFLFNKLFLYWNSWNMEHWKQEQIGKWNILEIKILIKSKLKIRTLENWNIFFTVKFYILNLEHFRNWNIPPLAFRLQFSFLIINFPLSPAHSLSIPIPKHINIIRIKNIKMFFEFYVLSFFAFSSASQTHT